MALSFKFKTGITLGKKSYFRLSGQAKIKIHSLNNNVEYLRRWNELYDGLDIIQCMQTQWLLGLGHVVESFQCSKAPTGGSPGRGRPPLRTKDQVKRDPISFFSQNGLEKFYKIIRGWETVLSLRKCNI